LDLTRLLPGAVATMMLGDFGAEHHQDRRAWIGPHDGSGPMYTFVIETHLPSLSKTTSPLKAFSRDTLHDQPFSLLVTVTSLAVTISGPTWSEPYNDNMAAAPILASSSVVIRINPWL